MFLQQVVYGWFLSACSTQHSSSNAGLVAVLQLATSCPVKLPPRSATRIQIYSFQVGLPFTYGFSVRGGAAESLPTPLRRFKAPALLLVLEAVLRLPIVLNPTSKYCWSVASVNGYGPWRLSGC
jgi:hypothetical protein